MVAALAVVGAVFGASIVGEAVWASVAGAPSAGAVEAGEQPSATHVAVPGDTLWSIADAHRGDVSRPAYLDALIRLNGGTTIQAGQAVSLP